MLRCYELAHIAGISKIAYELATPRCLDWRRDLRRTGTHERGAAASLRDGNRVRLAPSPPSPRATTRPIPRRHSLRGAPPPAQRRARQLAARRPRSHLPVDGRVAA